MADTLARSRVSSWKIKCFAVFPTDLIPLPHPRMLVSAAGQDDDGNALEKMEPGTISYLQPGEDVKGVGIERPGREFTTQPHPSGYQHSRRA